MIALSHSTSIDLGQSQATYQCFVLVVELPELALGPPSLRGERHLHVTVELGAAGTVKNVPEGHREDPGRCCCPRGRGCRGGLWGAGRRLALQHLAEPMVERLDSIADRVGRLGERVVTLEDEHPVRTLRGKGARGVCVLRTLRNTQN